MTPTEALAAYETADARRTAAKVEQESADAAWVLAAEQLAESIETALDGGNRRAVLIAGKVVRVEWDDYWTVDVQTPPVLA